MRRRLAPGAIAALLLATAPAGAFAASPSPSPSRSTSPSAAATTVAATTPPTTPPTPPPTSPPTPPPTSPPTPPPTSPPAATPAPTPAPTPDPAAQRLIDQARQQLGTGIADALATVQRLTDAMNQNASEQAQLQQRIDASQTKIDSLNAEIQRLDDQISTTQGQIDTERTEIGILARELYQQPDALLLRLLRAGSLRDMVTQTSDVTVAALRAASLRQKLAADLARLQQDQADRQKAADEEQTVQGQLNSALSQFQDLAQQEQDSGDQLQSAIGDTQSALDGLSQGQAVVQQAIDLLRQRQQQLITTAEKLVWQQAQLWATLNGSAIPTPAATTLGGTQRAPAGALFAWPIQGAVLTQGFGPSDLWLEPAMFGFPHFHTGLDLASANTRIGAAADGVVAAVGSGTTGYGNYVIIVHGGGLVTLYGHLALTMVKVGDVVTQGQQIGVEGTTGASTGVHLHFEVRLNGTPVDPSPYLPPLGAA